MTDHQQLPDKDIERLIKWAGPREAVDATRQMRVRGAVHEAWDDAVRGRARRRVWLFAGTGLAAAAAVLLAVAVTTPGVGVFGLGKKPTPGVVGHLVASSGVVTLDGGSVLRVGDAALAGMVINMAPGTLATVSLAGGGELRLDGGTRAVVQADRRLSIERGGIYIDSGASQGAPPVVVDTPLGPVRDVGTRFEVRVITPGIRVRVRDGAVRFERAGVQHEAVGGTELIAATGGAVENLASPRYGADWAWTARAAVPFRVEGHALSAFLDWVAREGGRTIAFDDRRLERAAETTILHGSIDGLTTDDALGVVLPTCGLTSRVDGDRIVIRRASAQGIK